MIPKVKALFQEFPFLWDDFASHPITETKVSRVDEGLLLKKLVQYGKDWSGNSSVYLYEENGRLVSGYGRRLSFFITMFGNNEPDETLGSHLQGRIAERTHYIAWYKEGRDDNILTLYKAPKGHSIATWLAKLEAEATTEIKATIEEIDKTAEPAHA